jgi:Cof subfamily protein (haloacid dehalogenase superfamily)
MVGLFASDLDGTLLGATHRVSRPVLRAIRAVTDSGRHFAVATGRVMRSPDDFGFADVPIEAVCANGAIVLGRDGSVLHHVPMDPDFVGSLLEAFPGVDLECVSLDRIYHRCSRDEFLAHRRGGSPVHRVLSLLVPPHEEEHAFGCSVEEIVLAGIVKVNCRPTDSEVAQALAAYVAAHPSQAVNAPFSPEMLEITDPAANKGSAVAWLAARLGLREDQVAVYGDGGNDVAMLRRFSRSYAPAGAMPKARDSASRVLGSNVLYAVPRHVMATVRDEGPFAEG